MKNDGVAARLQEVRASLGKNKTEMSALVGINRRAWEGYEAGRNFPGGEVFQRLAVLGFDTNWLLTGEGAMKRTDAPAQAAPAAASDIDEPLLKDIVSAVEIHLDERRITLSPDKKSLLISELYMLMLEEEMDEDASNDLVSRLVRLSS